MQRHLPMRPQPGGLRHWAQVGLTAAVFTCLTWKWFAWKGMVVTLPIWVGFEFFYRTRVRAAVTCTNCGFDPFLYLTDVQQAKQEIRRKYDERLQALQAARNPAQAPDGETSRDSEVVQ